MDYFKLFSLPRQFQIDKKILDKNFYKLQLKFHPDLFINTSEVKKKEILKKSIEINKGYITLKTSLNRSIYLLLLNGFKIKQEKLLSENQSFLKKYFFLYEELENLKIKDDSSAIYYNNFLKKMENEIKHCENTINFEFNNKNWNQMINAISQLLFLEKILMNIKT